MNSSALWALVGILIIAGLGFWFYSTQTEAPAPIVEVATTTEETASSNESGTGAGVGVDIGIGDASTPTAEARVTYGTNGFSPATITIAPGTRVTWTNTGSGRMWVGVDEHPTHTQYDGTSRAEHCDASYTGPAPFDQCAATATYSFVFTKTGTYTYHNHSAAAHVGTVVVQ